MDEDFETAFEALLDRYAADADRWKSERRAEVISILALKLEALEQEQEDE